MPFHASLGEVSHACKYILLSLKGNQSTQFHMQETAQMLGENVHFWLGDGMDAQKIIFWAEQLTAAQILPNSGLSNPTTKDFTIF